MLDLHIPEWMKPVFERTGHPYYVWDELMKTPECLRTVLENDAARAVRAAADAVADANAVHLLGCGSSYFSAIAGAYAFNRLAGIPAAAHNAFEFTAYPPAGLAGTAVIGISHTGGTAAVLDAIWRAESEGAVTVGLTDVDGSPLTAVARYVLPGGGGREKPLPKTRSFAVSLFKHFRLAVEVARRRGRDVSRLDSVLEQSPDVARRVLDEQTPVARRIASGLRSDAAVFLFGAGPNVACALDGALKLQEMVQASAHGLELEEGMHGPWVAMEPGDLAVVYALNGPGYEKAKRFVSALSALGVDVWILTDEPNDMPDAAFVSRLPDVPELFSPLYSALPVYGFAYELALARGIRPDSMRLTDERYLEVRLKLPR